jgi:hypothetical protein
VIYVVIALLLAFLALRFWIGTADDPDS